MPRCENSSPSAAKWVPICENCNPSQGLKAPGGWVERRWTMVGRLGFWRDFHEKDQFRLRVIEKSENLISKPP